MSSAKKLFLLLLASVATVSLCACSTYSSRWKVAVTLPESELEGAWAGEWKSNTGAGGKLWCILSKKDRDTYVAEFKATWHGIFKSEHSAVLITASTARFDSLGKVAKDYRGRGKKFSGEASIHTWIGSGSYTCDGVINSELMLAVYDSSYDQGVFELKRVKAP